MRDLFADIVIVSKTKVIDQVFSYKVPSDLIDILKVGHKVIVPFGKGNTQYEGYVFALKDSCAYKGLKNIITVVDEDIYFDEDVKKLVQWIRESYVCNYADALSLFIPAGTSLKKEKYEDVVDGVKTIKYKFTSVVNDKRVSNIMLNMDTPDLQERILNLSERSHKQHLLIDRLNKLGKSRDLDVRRNLNIPRSTVDKLIEKKIIKEEIEDEYRLPEYYKSEHVAGHVVLNEEQENTFDVVSTAVVKKKCEKFLLKGVTGSGKTEIYMELAELSLEMNKSVLVLVPEISLTPQIVDKFRQRFGDNVAVLHSKLSPGQRYDQFKGIKTGKYKIVIGARSAVFAPIKNLGLIIVDEAHDTSYKSDNMPKYNAVDIAEKMSEVYSIPILMGSATPSVEQYYRSTTGQYTLIEINNRFNNTPLPNVSIVDMRDELTSGNRTMFSTELAESIKETLENNKQVMLLLNRKGYNTFVSCRSCGYSMKCPNCDVALVYHKDSGVVRCNYCNHSVPMPKTCPECSSKYFKHFGTGTEKVEEFAKSVFPGYNIARMDSETISKKGSLESIISRYSRGEIDILIGTQIISKGLDFHNVGLVGVVLADVTLNLPDYLATERTFQLLTQVAGRTGRREDIGNVVIQTYESDNYSIRATEKHDYIGFYNQEILLRREFEYPPFKNMANMILSGENEAQVDKAANELHMEIKVRVDKKKLQNIDLLDANPALYSKIKGKYRWQVLMKYKESELEPLRDIIKLSINKVRKNNANVRITCDVKAVNIM